MTDYTSQIDAWYEAIQYRTPPASELASFNAQLQGGFITTAQAVAQIEASSYTQTYVDPVIREYQAAFGRVPDQAGVAYWVGQVAANPANLAVLSAAFANSPEFFADYAATATTPASSTLVTALYNNVLGRVPDAAGLAYWSNSGLDAAQLLQSFAQSAEFIKDSGPYVVQFQNLEVAGNPPTSGSLLTLQIPGGIAANTYTITYGAPTTYTFTGTAGGQTVTGTVAGGPTGPISSPEAAGNSNVTINAALGLNNSQSIFFNGTNNVLNADYTPGVGLSSLTNSNFPASNFDQVGLNIQGVQTWNIQAEVPVGSSSAYNTITFTGDALTNPANLISGLQTVNFNDNSGITSLLIGNNPEPVQEPNGANGFTINVSNAVGTGSNGVDVDIAAQAFTGTDTINVGAQVVGGFPLDSGGSYVIPPFEIGANNGDKDDYNPNWTGFEGDAFAIAAGASSGPNGSIGFQNWVISSTGAKSVGSMNIIALGGEGSTTAQTITLTDDGSPTMLFASAISDSLSTDWENLTTIDLSGTTGNVVITGAETDAQSGGFSLSNGGGGLLTSDTTQLKTIAGGQGNSFYDLSSLTLAGIQAFNGAESYDGGHGRGANSEIAFNNGVVANATIVQASGSTPPSISSTVVNISNIQVLDDTGYLAKGVTTFNAAQGASNSLQGGVIDMADFALDPLNTNYDLLSGPLGNLFYVKGGSLLQDPTFAAGNDVAPAGFQLLQLLDADGSTQSTLAQNLTIANGFTDFAVNMQDVADGTFTSGSGGYRGDPRNYGDWNYGNYDAVWGGYNITIWAASPVSVNDHLKLWLSDDGATVTQVKSSTSWELVPTPGTESWTSSGYTYTVNTMVDVWQQVTTPAVTFTALNVPVFTVDNYTTTDIYLPYESVTTYTVTSGDPRHPTTTTFADQNYVILGSQDPWTNPIGPEPGFNVQPLVTGQAFVNFYDNTTDTGGSPPGGPDNLVLGWTNFTADLAPFNANIPDSPHGWFDPTAAIGITTVNVDSTTVATTINDFGTGTLEIGATNATNLNAQSTAGLFMDLPATLNYVVTDGFTPGSGITVHGSLTGQNLLQGSSGTVSFDVSGYVSDTGHVPAGTYLSGSPSNLFNYNPGVLETTDYAGVWAVGSDNLYGGTSNDNFFPEGGHDNVYITHPTTGYSTDTVWVAMYDVSSTASSTIDQGPNHTGPNPHYTYGQAVTDITASGQEVYVDGYGPGTSGTSTTGPLSGSSTSSLTITGFAGNDTGVVLNGGDVLNFDPYDWATGSLSGGINDKGLVDAVVAGTGGGTTGTITVPGNGTGHIQASLWSVGFAGETPTTPSPVVTSANVILDEIPGGYQNAAQLVDALASNTGDIGLTIWQKTQEHVLIAYNLVNSSGQFVGTEISDVTLTNTSSSAVNSTNNSSVHIKAVDMVELVGVNMDQLLGHNIQFAI